VLGEYWETFKNIFEHVSERIVTSVEENTKYGGAYFFMNVHEIPAVCEKTCLFFSGKVLEHHVYLMCYGSTSNQHYRFVQVHMLCSYQ